jgi:hypothetical protein
MYVSTAYPNHVLAFDPGNPGRIRWQPRPKRARPVRLHVAGARSELLAGRLPTRSLILSDELSFGLAPKVVNQRVDALQEGDEAAVRSATCRISPLSEGNEFLLNDNRKIKEAPARILAIGTVDSVERPAHGLPMSQQAAEDDGLRGEQPGNNPASTS